MAQTKSKVRKQKNNGTIDSVYFFKLLLFLIIGSLWVKVSDNQTWQIPIPVGLIIGLVLASHEHFSIDRKIEYAVLLVAMFVGFWAPIGLYVTI